MRKGFIAVLASGAAALTIGIGTTAAVATTATTWKITPGGAIKGSATTPTLKDTKTGTTLKCKTSATKATLKKGSGQTNPIGKITSVTFSSCTGPDGLTFTATTTASTSKPYPLSASSFSGGVTTGSITKIKATISGTGCSATVGGTTASATGKVTGKYSNKTHKLSTSGGNLHIWNVSGCFGLINAGDPSSYKASYTVSPAQTITKS
jgi:hypothetical protein